MDDADTPWWIQRAWLSGRNGEELTSLGHGCGLVGRHCETFVKEKQQLDGLPHLFFCWLLLVAFFFFFGLLLVALVQGVHLRDAQGHAKGRGQAGREAGRRGSDNTSNLQKLSMQKL